MHRPRTYSLEAHGYAATLYLSGAASVRAVLEALRACEQLPSTVWLLRVDLAPAGALDAGTHRVLAEALRRWREPRAGVTHVLSAGTRFPFGVAAPRAGAFALRQRAVPGAPRVV